eukprot:8405525-Pyramimonas_sp.AAC.1
MEGGEALKTAKQALEEKEKGLHELGDYKTRWGMGAQQAQHLTVLDFVVEWGDKMQLHNARRRGAGWGADKNCACLCGLDFPKKLWWRGPGATSRGD